MVIYEKLMNIQQKLKANKSQYNSFGKYSYRSCEDILEALKPLLLEFKSTLIIKDDLVNVGDRYYIKSTAKLQSTEDDTFIESTAYAREEESKKGMDGSQVTGASSSYARKYALNGLFCIDDNKDSDSTNMHGKELKEEDRTDKTFKQVNAQTNTKTTFKLTDSQIKRLYTIASNNSISEDDVKKYIYKKYGIKTTTALNKEQYEEVCAAMQNKK